MKYKRFEDLPVWRSAIKLALETYDLTSSGTCKGYSGLRNQIERAALSVSNNIAEGFERGTTAELLNFLYIARGLAGEVRSMLCLLEQVDGFANLKSEISNLKFLVECISRQLRGWADALQNSEIKGQRYLTDKIRQSMQNKKEREEFLRELHAENAARIKRVNGFEEAES